MVTESEFLKHNYLNPERYPADWFEQLTSLEAEINKSLSKDPKFNGIDFCDVSSGGIQIRLSHKDVQGYCVGAQFTLKYDFSNIDDALPTVIEYWKEASKPESVGHLKDFIEWGEKYGWD